MPSIFDRIVLSASYHMPYNMRLYFMVFGDERDIQLGPGQLAPEEYEYMRGVRLSVFRSPLIRLKGKLGIDILDSTFDAQLETIVEESTSFAVDIGAEPILHKTFSEAPLLSEEINIGGDEHGIIIYGVYSWHEVFYSPLTKWPPHENDPSKPDYKKWLSNYQAYDKMNIPFGTFDKEAGLDVIPLGDLSYSDEDYDALTKDEVPYYMTLKYNKAYNDFITLLDELCYVNAKIYFDSPDSGYVTNQYAQRKGELQWRIQSVLEDRMGLPNTWQIVEEPKWEQEP